MQRDARVRRPRRHDTRTLPRPARRRTRTPRAPRCAGAGRAAASVTRRATVGVVRTVGGEKVCRGRRAGDTRAVIVSRESECGVGGGHGGAMVSRTLLVAKSTSAPASIRRCAMPRWPLMAAHINAVAPTESSLSRADAARAAPPQARWRDKRVKVEEEERRAKERTGSAVGRGRRSAAARPLSRERAARCGGRVGRATTGQRARAEAPVGSARRGHARAGGPG